MNAASLPADQLACLTCDAADGTCAGTAKEPA